MRRFEHNDAIKICNGTIYQFPLHTHPSYYKHAMHHAMPAGGFFQVANYAVECGMLGFVVYSLLTSA